MNRLKVSRKFMAQFMAHKKKKPWNQADFRACGGDKRDRTADLLNAMDFQIL